MMLNKKNSEKKVMLNMTILPIICGLLLLSQCTGFTRVSSKTEKNKNAILQYPDLDVKPEFEGGSKALSTYISTNIKYPKEALENGIEGRVFVVFVINEEGDIEQVNSVRAAGTMIKAYPSDTLRWKIDNGKAVIYPNKYGETSALTDVKEIQPALLLEQEAKRVISNMPKWKPGELKGKKKKVKYLVPVNFKIPN